MFQSDLQQNFTDVLETAQPRPRVLGKRPHEQVSKETADVLDSAMIDLPEEFSVCVKTTTGKKVSVRVTPTTTVDELKAELKDLLEISVAEQRLILHGRVLANGIVLAAVGIRPGSLLYCMQGKKELLTIMLRGVKVQGFEKTLTVRGSWTIEQLKDHLEQEYRMPVRQMGLRFFYLGHHMDDNRTLHDYGLRDDATLYLVPRIQVVLEGIRRNGEKFQVDVSRPDLCNHIVQKIIDNSNKRRKVDPSDDVSSDAQRQQEQAYRPASPSLVHISQPVSAASSSSSSIPPLPTLVRTDSPPDSSANFLPCMAAPIGAAGVSPAAAAFTVGSRLPMTGTRTRVSLPLRACTLPKSKVLSPTNNSPLKRITTPRSTPSVRYQSALSPAMSVARAHIQTPSSSSSSHARAARVHPLLNSSVSALNSVRVPTNGGDLSPGGASDVPNASLLMSNFPFARAETRSLVLPRPAAGVQSSSSSASSSSSMVQNESTSSSNSNSPANMIPIMRSGRSLLPVSPFSPSPRFGGMSSSFASSSKGAAGEDSPYFVRIKNSPTSMTRASNPEENLRLFLEAKSAELGENADSNNINNSSNNKQEEELPTAMDVSTNPQSASKSCCAMCHKKLRLTAIRCRCGQLYCANHRHAESHSCTFDYAVNAKSTLERNNPKVSGDKLASRI
eukprot:GILK01002135.1.p1 GENE.GILK01002135.1~~GILK01002135.1.p1  ORF type:complete len:673 (-),score=117.09 GILK01002135.1:280-2298(-)